MDKEIAFKITKNFSALIIAHVIYKICTFLVVILIARFLGAERFGEFSYGLSFVWAFLYLSDCGLSELFIRDVASNNRLLGKYINNIVSLKIFLSILAYIILISLASIFSFSAVKFWVILSLGGAIILDSFMYFFRCLFRVRETMEYEAILMIIEAFLKLGIIFIAIKLFHNSTGTILVSFAVLIVSFINFFINLFVFKLNYKNLFLSVDIKFYMYLLRNSFPFALVSIFSLVNFRVDIIMLSIMKGDTSAGLYNANFKLLEPLFLIPLTLSCVYLPLFSRLSNSVYKLHHILLKTILLFFSLAVVIIVLFYLFGHYAIQLIYGKEFKNAIQYTFAISLVLAPFFIKPILEKLLNALGRQRTVCLIYFMGTMGNFFLNLIMIPKWGINGASYATLLIESLLVIICIFIYKKFYACVIVKQRAPFINTLMVEDKMFY